MRKGFSGVTAKILYYSLRSLWFLMPVIMGLLFGCSSSAELAFDNTFSRNNSSYLPVTEIHRSGILNVSFGPYSMSRIGKVDTLTTKDKDVSGGFIVFRRTVTKEYRDVFRYLMHSKTDSAGVLLQILSKTTESRPSLLKQLKGKDEPSDYYSSTEPNVLRGVIHVYSTGRDWEFSMQGDVPIIASEQGYLSNADKILLVERLERGNAKKKMLTFYGPVAGVLLNDNHGRNIAALKFRGKKQLWISNQADNEQRLVIAAFFASIISGVKYKH